MKDVFEGAAYEFRVSAINLSGAGDPSIPCDTVIARDPMSKPLTLLYSTAVVFTENAAEPITSHYCNYRTPRQSHGPEVNILQLHHIFTGLDQT